MKNRETLLDREKSTNSLLTILIVLASISGFITYFVEGHGEWQQWAWLLHAVVAVALTVQFVPYLFVHLQRTLAFRRWSLVSSGSVTVGAIFVLVATGSVLVYVGQTEQQSWLLQYHVYGAFAFVSLILLHIVLHATTLTKKRRQVLPRTYASVESGLGKQIVVVILITVCVVALLGFSTKALRTPYSTDPIVADYEKPYGEHPFRPSQTETWHNQFVDYRQIGNSNDCSGCHSEITKEWRSSIHRHAASDKTYVTNVSLLAKNRGVAATRYCEGCHSPVALLSGQLSEGGDHGGIEGTLAFDEGVGCMGCHGIKRATHLNGVASYEFEAAQDYLFSGTDNDGLTSLRNFLIRLRPDQHKNDLARPVLSSPKLCATCHAQFMDKDMNNWGWVKMQDEYAAWLDSPYSQQHDKTFSNQDLVRCQDCHMPLVDGSDPSANEQGQYRSHRFLGANTVVPLITGDKEQLKLTKEFLQKNKMRINIEEPRRKDATQTLMSLDESIRTDTQTPYYVYLGEQVEIKVIVSNIGVGHNFPGGTLDINEAWVAITVMDASSQVVYQSGQIQEDNTVDPDALFYRSLPIDKAGNHVWKHDLFNRVGEAYKNFVAAGQSDILSYKFQVPEWAKGPLTITATLKYRKLNERYARWALQELYQPIPIIDVAKNSLALPVKIRSEVEKLK